MWVDLVRVPPSGTWEQRRADLYGLADDSVGNSSPTETEALDRLVRRYLGGFGPASLNDLSSWAGLQLGTLRPVVERLGLRRFRDERGGELLDLPRAPLPDADTSAPVRFLPTWDATLLAHARRTQILPEPYRPLCSKPRPPTRYRRSLWTAPSRERGAIRNVACASSHSLDFLRPPGARWRRRRNAWPLFTRTRCRCVLIQ